MPNKFPINGNVFDQNPDFNEQDFQKMKEEAVKKVEELFDILLIERCHNTSANENSSKSTAERFVKSLIGGKLDDDGELLSGRFMRDVEIPKFENKLIRGEDIHSPSIPSPVSVEANLVSNCSHHLLIFHGKVTVKYIPGKFLLGLSKFQRMIDMIARRGWLQEDLTKAIFVKIANAAETENVYVRIEAEHSCVKHRGAKSSLGKCVTEIGLLALRDF